MGRAPSGSSADPIADTSTSDRRPTDRRSSKPIARLAHYDESTMVDLQTIDDDRSKGKTLELNIGQAAEEDVINQASSSNDMDPYLRRLEWRPV